MILFIFRGESFVSDKLNSPLSLWNPHACCIHKCRVWVSSTTHAVIAASKVFTRICFQCPLSVLSVHEGPQGIRVPRQGSTIDKSAIWINTPTPAVVASWQILSIVTLQGNVISENLKVSLSPDSVSIGCMDKGSIWVST